MLNGPFYLCVYVCVCVCVCVCMCVVLVHQYHLEGEEVRAEVRGVASGGP